MNNKRWYQKTGWRIFIATVLLVIISGIFNPIGPKDKEKSAQNLTPSTKQKYPNLTEETMDRNFILSCEGGDEVVLWDKPTDLAGGVQFKYRVPCGTFGWAFNKYYNEELKVTFYAINTNDKRVKNAYGWITEDFLTWRE